MRSNRGARLFAGLIATCALVAGCSNTTNGAGQLASRPPVPTSSEPGFPSTPPPETTTAPTTSAPSTSAPSAPTGTSQPAPGQPLRTVSVTGADGKTYVIKIWADVKNRTCFNHAYGQPIVNFLTRHPCTGLERYLATTTVNGRPVGLAESATGFPGTAKDPYRWAGRFATLENANGTGSLNDLLREGYRLPSGPTAIPRSEAFNVISQDQGVTVWDAWYLDGPTPTNDPALIRMTRDAFLQF